MTDEETGSCGTSASDEQMDDNEIDSVSVVYRL